LVDTILTTKLYAPQPPPRSVPRARLIERLDEGCERHLTLVSAPAGFGKTTAIATWVAGCGRPVAWLSLDAADRNPARFVAHLIAALQTIRPHVGQGVLGTLFSPQPPLMEAILTVVLNDIAASPERFILVLDDYHVVDAREVDDAVAFLLEHLPPQMHLVITTREDPQLPLARLRARGQMTELRATDLRFNPAEATAFLNDVMGLSLAEDDVTSLGSRTEGWITGLQLAAISMRGLDDATGFIASFTGSHRFVLDYLVEEVLHQQTERVQAFLLRTSILDRLCGPLCDAVVGDPATPGRETLEYLERINLFLVPLDNERRWYRYHHLFAELLRQRLLQSLSGRDGAGVTEYHARASTWFEAHGHEIEAFQHAAAAQDVERAERLIAGPGMPLYIRGGTTQVLEWLASLPTPVLNARPALWVTWATALLVAGYITRVEPTLQAAEAAVRDMPPDDVTRDLMKRMVGPRAIVALMTEDVRQFDTIIAQSRRALEVLPPDNLRERATTSWKLGLAYQLQGERGPARPAFVDAIAAGEASGNTHITILASTSLGKLQEMDNHLHLADETYRRVLQLVGDPPRPLACEAYLGLARLAYEWNDLEAAQQFAQQSVTLARQMDIASFASSELLLARLQLTSGDVSGAIAALAQTEQAVREREFWFRLPAVAAAQVLAFLRHGDLGAAAQLGQAYDLPTSLARVHLAHGDAPAALAVLAAWRAQVETRGWQDERLKVLVLQAVAHSAHGDRDAAVRVLGEALTVAEPGGFVRIFIDEGAPMARLLSHARAQGIRPDYAGKLLAACAVGERASNRTSDLPSGPPAQRLVEPLSGRELEVLGLIAHGLSNRAIADRLFLAVDTVKGHNRVIFSKLQVKRRTEAVARARELNLI
jgi:LuxR family maltose regulon positive regulatory protein